MADFKTPVYRLPFTNTPMNPVPVSEEEGKELKPMFLYIGGAVSDQNTHINPPPVPLHEVQPSGLIGEEPMGHLQIERLVFYVNEDFSNDWIEQVGDAIRGIIVQGLTVLRDGLKAEKEAAEQAAEPQHVGQE